MENGWPMHSKLDAFGTSQTCCTCGMTQHITVAVAHSFSTPKCRAPVSNTVVFMEMQ